MSEVDAPAIRALWLPPGTARELGVERPAPERPVALTAAQAVDLCATLPRRRMQLLERPAATIVADLGRVSQRWISPAGEALRAAAERRVAEDTGYPPALIARSLGHFFRSHSEAALRSLVAQSLGALEALDDFVPSVAGRSRAFGPSLTLLFASGNVPVAPLATVYHSLLVKSPCVARAPSGNPWLLAFLGQSLCEAAPELGEYFALLHWEHDEDALTQRMAFEADAVVAFGSDVTIATLAARVPPGVRLLGYGHRLGFGVIGREALTAGAVEQTAAAAAIDVAGFDQQGCVSPQWFYVEEGGETSPDRFAGQLAEALARLEPVWPRRALSPGEASAIHQARAVWEVRADACVRCGPGTAWTVVYTSDPAPEPSPLNRFVLVKPVADPVRALPDLSPLARYLQTVSVAIGPTRLPALAERLGLAGVTRICPLGRAQEPLPGHHDGASPLGELVRWVNLE